jgi:outer membrane protein TolC
VVYGYSIIVKNEPQYRSTDRHYQMLSISVSLFFALMIASCQTAQQYQREADLVAAEIISQKQQEAFGNTEPFTIETPAETLRKRLLHLQKLPTSGPESLVSVGHTSRSNWTTNTTGEGEQLNDREKGDRFDDEGLTISLLDALSIAAANNRDYLSLKEDVFLSALDLDLERQEFRNTYTGLVDVLLGRNQFEDGSISGGVGSALASWTRKFESGATLATRLFVDVVKLLSLGQESSTGILMDLSIAVPLMRGSGENIVTEPMKQAERNVLYALYGLERFKSGLAVQVASDYLNVLRQFDQLKNSRKNYDRLQVAADRARRLAEAGRLPEIQVDQADQDVLRALDRFVADQEAFEQAKDLYKRKLGLPVDARIGLDQSELIRLSDLAAAGISEAGESAMTRAPGDHRKPGESDQPNASSGAFSRLLLKNISPEMNSTESIETALRNRQDLLVLRGAVYDSERRVIVAADGLGAELNLEAGALVGSRRSALTASFLENGRLKFADGSYSARLQFDLPWERTAERNSYRESFIALERAVRNVQDKEDQIKLEVRTALRRLKRAREGYKIQRQSLALAQKRVTSTELFLEAGRAEIRDMLEAQEALIVSQNAVTSTLVDYRVAQLELMRDMDILKIDHTGLWHTSQNSAQTGTNN